MSETSSDAESSCGWTILSNEGSDIETLGSEAPVEYRAELLDSRPLEDTVLQDLLASASDGKAGRIEERRADSLDETLEEQTVEETLCTFEDRDNVARKEHMTLLSSSDHSDIVTLRDLKEDEHADVEEEEEETVADEKIYLGTSCSSQYAFTAAETVFQAPRPAGKNSSSSEDEAIQSPSAVTRRRRTRKNATCTVASPDDEEEDQGDGEEEEEPAELGLAQRVEMQGRASGILNKLVLFTVIIAVSMGFSYVCDRLQIQETREAVEKIRVDDGVMEELPQNLQPFKTQAQTEDMELLLKRNADERNHFRAQQQGLMAENTQLRRSLDRKEAALSTSQEELRNLRSTIRDAEATTATADLLVSENKRLKEQLEKEKQLMGDVYAQREGFMAEAQTARKKLDKERKVTDELRRELSRMRRDARRTGDEKGSEGEGLKTRLAALDKKLSFEQQRSNLWERLYVETKEECDKGPKDSKGKKPMAGKVKETFDAVKNSTMEFIHHHKEQIKKSKEAVKENLKKFSDSVKHTFRHFKDSASAFFNKARVLRKKKCDKKETQESWKHRFHQPPPSHPHDDSFESNQYTRKSGHPVHQDGGRRSPNRESGTFDGASEPIRAEEFLQVMQSYLQQEFDHLHHGKELETFINNYFRDGVFVHDQMLFTDFIRGVENYLAYMREHQGLTDGVFGDLEDYVHRHFFGKTRRDPKKGSRPKHQQAEQHRATARSERQ